MTRLLLLALAGCCGTLARYWLSGLVHDRLGSAFPWGTAVVNLLGCILFGLLWVVADERGLMRPEARLIILVGFMGSFTTFSSLIFETAELARGSRWALAACNIAGQNLLGLAAFVLGTIIGRAI